MRMILFATCIVVIIFIHLEEGKMDTRIQVSGDFEELEAQLDTCRLDYKWSRKQNVLKIYSEDLNEVKEILEDTGIQYHIITRKGK